MDTEIKLDIKNLKTLLQNIEKNVSVKVGVLSAKDSRSDGESNSKLAHLHEFGGISVIDSRDGPKIIHVPERSIMRLAIPAFLPNKVKEYKSDSDNFDILGDMSEFIGLQTLEVIKDNFKQEGSAESWEILATETIKRREERGNFDDTILDDTGQLKDSFGYEVVK